jgi:hypothetical protein
MVIFANFKTNNFFLIFKNKKKVKFSKKKIVEKIIEIFKILQKLPF